MEINKLDGSSFDIVEDNIQKLKELFPQVVNGDNEVDFDILRDIFEKYDETIVDDSEEHYKFTWWGKKKANYLSKCINTKTLRPVKEDSKNWDSTGNIYIEGDNLDALKILLGSYRNKIKMIYIDPPYNTGKDFVYVDKFSETTQEHFESTGQLNEDGFLEENPITEGKYHSRWLNMMYPRLKLARNFLTEDGVIFISIDNNELENLKKICNEIFGEINYISQLAWFKSYGKNESNFFSNNMEYILIYCKNINFLSENKENHFLIEKEGFNEVTNLINECKKLNYSKEKMELEIKSYYKNNPHLKGIKAYNKLNDNFELWRPVSMEKPKDPCYFYDIIHPITNKPCKVPNKGWRMPFETMQKWYENNEIAFGKDETTIPNRKYFLKDMKYETPKNFISNSDQGGNDILNIFEGNHVFDYPKPVSLISYLINIMNIENNYILDFFSGSATTAHAVFKSNLDKSFNNNFILIQLPEITYDNIGSKKVPKKFNKDAFKLGFDNICEIGKERIRRAGNKIVEESEDKDLDVGFKVFKVDESNFVPWNPKLTKDNVKQAVLDANKNLVRGRSELDLVYELLLKLDFDLNSSIDEVVLDNEFNNKIYVVRNGFMFICLDDKLSDSIADDLLKLKEELKSSYSQVVLKDEALNDTKSINIYELLKLNKIEFYTI